MSDNGSHVRINLTALNEWATRARVDPVLLVNSTGAVVFSTDGPHPWNHGQSDNLSNYLRDIDRLRFQCWLAGMTQRSPLAREEFNFVDEDGVLKTYEFIAFTCQANSVLPEILLIGREGSPHSTPQVGLAHGTDETATLINHLRESVIGNISHELRTPLNGIVLASDLLAQTEIPTGQLELVSCIRESAGNLLETLSEIADYAAITGGFWTFNSRSFLLSELIHSIETTFVPRANEKELEFRILRDRRIPDCLFGDVDTLHQIIERLLNNAIKFTEQGLVQIHFHNRGVDESTVAVVVEVFDTGLGIDENALTWICDPFRQADSSISRETQGLGLGLAICQTLALRLRTRLLFESSLGEGSRFWIPFYFRIQGEAPEPPIPKSIRN